MTFYTGDMLSSSTYYDRKNQARPAEQLLEKYLDTQPNVKWSRRSVEELYPIAVTYLLARLSAKYPLLNHIRRCPDFLMTWNDRTSFIDAKYGPHVERGAYEHYQHVAETIRPVFLAVMLDDEPDRLRMVRVQDIVFTTSEWRTSDRGSGTLYKTIDWQRTKFAVVTP